MTGWWGSPPDAATAQKPTLGRVPRRLVVAWAVGCVEHVLPIYADCYPADQRLIQALDITLAWCRGDASRAEIRPLATGLIFAEREAVHRRNEESVTPWAWAGAVAVVRAAQHAVRSINDIGAAHAAACSCCEAVTDAVERERRRDAHDAEAAWQQSQLPEAARGLSWLTVRSFGPYP